MYVGDRGFTGDTGDTVEWYIIVWDRDNLEPGVLLPVDLSCDIILERGLRLGPFAGDRGETGLGMPLDSPPIVVYRSSDIVFIRLVRDKEISER